MKCVILAGGSGKRFFEETVYKPKPMIEICGKPIILHIIDTYMKYNISEFIICAGYKYKIIDQYFKKKLNYKYYKKYKDIKINVVNTGLKTMTGGRIKKIQKQIGNDENFLLTYGDGLCNFNLHNLKKIHIRDNNIVTLTAVNPIARFGVLNISKNKVIKFLEKPVDKKNFINGGFFIIHKNIFKIIKNNHSILEDDVLNLLAKKGKLGASFHKSFWYSMDNAKDKEFLDSFSNRKKLPWN